MLYPSISSGARKENPAPAAASLIVSVLTNGLAIRADVCTSSFAAHPDVPASSAAAVTANTVFFIFPASGLILLPLHLHTQKSHLSGHRKRKKVFGMTEIGLTRQENIQ